jgi:predicted methyltransferase
MKRTLLMAALLIASPLASAAKGGADWLAIPNRAEADVKMDAGRKPVETLRWLGIKPGDAALDYMAGGGYYAEIMARAVGPKGRVVAWNPENFVASEKAQAKWKGLIGGNANLSHQTSAFDKFDAPANSYSFALMHLVYHDLYWQSEQFKVPKTDPDAVLKRLYAAMKPGGVVGVIDHMGAPGDTRTTVEKTHRIDPAVVKADFARAGFRFAGESQLLRVAGDDYAVNVFDPKSRGKTDRFVFKFVKPKKG